MPSNPDYNLQFQKELEKLNTAQKQAVFHTEGPVLVIAGPGTGKTQILSARIGYILSSKNLQVAPHNILCLTYTDAGVIAMRNRLLKFIGPDAYRVHIHTFHSFCNQVIQNNMDYFGIRELHPISELETIELYHKLIDQFPQGHLLKKYRGEIYSDIGRLKSLFSTMKTEDWSPEFISQQIDLYLEELPSRDNFIYKVNRGQNKKGDPKIREIQEETERMEKLRAAAFEYHNFNKLMKSMGRYDFDDMILWVLEGFKNNESLRLKYQEQYLYFLVDEFQDTNGSQNEILNLLTEDPDENPNVFVVGDDDQSIYRFQGANLKNITDFALRYERNLYKVVLTENYRSTQSILNTAQSLINFNSQRLVNTFNDIQKNLISSSSLKYSLVRPEIKTFPNPQNEEAFILSEIERLKQLGEDLSEVAVIYRKHKLVENLVKVMEQKKIPLNLKQRVNILKLPFIKNLIHLLTYLQQEFERPHSAENLLFEVMHYDFFGISPRDIARISLHCSHIEEGVYKKWREVISSKETMFRLGLESAGAVSSLEDNLNYWFKSMANDTLQVLFEKIITKGGILKYIMNSPDKIWLMESLTSFFDFLKSNSEKEENFGVKNLLSLVEKMESHDLCIYLNKIISNPDGVNFVTAHSSKGLEFKHVYLLSSNARCWEKSRGVNRGFKLPDTIVPSIDEDLEEEERRLFYVALTRAKENLTISYSKEDRNSKEQEKSRFVTEIKIGEELNETDISLEPDALLDFNYLNLSLPEIAKSDLINKAFIDASLKNYRMSVTHLSKYLKCPLTFYFENIIKVPSARNESMGFGNAVHYTLEKFFRQMLDSGKKEFSSKEELYEIFKKGMQKYHAHFTKEQFKRKMEYGQEILPGFYQTYIERWNKVVVVEYRLNHVEAEGVPLTGILDKLEFDGNVVNVVDYKTGKPENGIRKLNPPSEADPLGGDYWRQMVFYKILMDSDKTKKWEMISGEFDFIEKNSKKEYEKRKLVISPEDIKIVKGQLKEAYGKILNHEFMPGCGKEDCQWCNFVKNNFTSPVDLSVVDEE
ncbi:MAG TPA: ATP-dependent DNA helicase [Cytophagales bacterium]|nr:ATP-dependent DNA helicase [Cytophagales bacterium]